MFVVGFGFVLDFWARPVLSRLPLFVGADYLCDFVLD